jgi:hypothetical protein
MAETACAQQATRSSARSRKFERKVRFARLDSRRSDPTSKAVGRQQVFSPSAFHRAQRGRASRDDCHRMFSRSQRTRALPVNISPSSKSTRPTGAGTNANRVRDIMLSPCSRARSYRSPRDPRCAIQRGQWAPPFPQRYQPESARTFPQKKRRGMARKLLQKKCANPDCRRSKKRRDYSSRAGQSL